MPRISKKEDNSIMNYNLFKTNKNIATAIVLAILAIGIAVYYLLTPVSTLDEVEYIYIDDDDTMDSVCVKMDSFCSGSGRTTLHSIMRHMDYADNIRTGRYAIRPGENAIIVYRHLSRGLQTSINLTIPSVRTVEDLAEKLGEKLMVDADDILDELTDSAVCAKYGYDMDNIIGMFIPNTYDIYWNVSIENLLDRMKKESDVFWTQERKDKANAKQMTPQEVITLASIVDEETANKGEKPMVAGMYINRLKKNMPLQADPTIKFALKQFELKRIYNNMLHTQSPFNTYINTGLPPGPIRIPSIDGIDAVLNAVEHNFVYMCAKEDFSGTHNFAVTYSEHLKNAAKYSKALNERGIK